MWLLAFHYDRATMSFPAQFLHSLSFPSASLIPSHIPPYTAI